MARTFGRKRSEASSNPSGAIANISGVESLFSGFNSSSDDVSKEGDGVLASPRQPLLALDMEDSELLALARQWRRTYDTYYKEIQDRQEDNYQYWLGKQKGSSGVNSRGTDNVIFESVETLLPIVSRQNPEPYIHADNTEEGDVLSEMTSEILFAKADETRLKSKIKTVARDWALYFLGCMKMGWKEEVNDMYFQVIDPTKLILDPTGYFDGGEFIGRYIGEKKTATAQELSETFPEHKDAIKALATDQMGTVLNYVEWWTNDYVFWQFQSIILDKRQNPYWNGSEEKKTMDEYGVEQVVSTDGVNHFATPKMPYTFLSVFNTGKQPHDETSLVEQVKSLQDIVHKRLRQIDKNADETNNGWVFNGNHFSEDQASTALAALKRGGAILSDPRAENIEGSVQRMTAPQLASYVYQDMQDKREQIYNIMGVRGSTAQGVISEKTVRGKIEIKGQDVDRLALVVEQIEQMVDHLYNLAVQTIYVYYTPENAVRVLGQEKGNVYLQTLKAGPSRRLIVSVKEGSTIPKDPLTKRNEAIDLWNAHAIDPRKLFQLLDFPDPDEEAKNLLQYQIDPSVLLQELGGMPPTPPGMPAAPEAGVLAQTSPQIPTQNIPMNL